MVRTPQNFCGKTGTPHHMSCVLGFSTKSRNNSVFPEFPFQIFNHLKIFGLLKPNANESKCVFPQVVEKIS